MGKKKKPSPKEVMTEVVFMWPWSVDSKGNKRIEISDGTFITPDTVITFAEPGAKLIHTDGYLEVHTGKMIDPNLAKGYNSRYNSASSVSELSSNTDHIVDAIDDEDLY